MTELETTTELSLDEQVYWVKYKESTGRIYAIKTTEIPEEEGYSILETRSDTCKSAMRKSLRSFKVQWNIFSNQWDIVDKNSKDLLVGKEFPVFGIKSQDSADSDIHVTLLKSKNALLVTANRANISSHTSMTTISEIVSLDESLFNIYIVPKYAPWQLIRNIKINATELFSKGSVWVDLDFDVTQWVAYDDILFMTRQVCQNYTFAIVDIHDESLAVNNRVLQTAIRDEGNISIRYDDNMIRIRSKLSHENWDKVSKFRYLLFMVCDYTIDNISGVFSVTPQDLINGESIDIPLNFKWPDDPIILHRNNALTVQILEEPNNG